MPSVAKRPSSLSSRRGARQLLQQPSIQADVLTHHDTGRVILSFLDAPALGNVAAVCRPLHALANADAVWRELLLAERPHLLPLLQMAGAGGAKALCVSRMGEEEKGAAPTPSEASEQKRLRSRLAECFIHLKVYDYFSGQILGSCTVPCSDEAKMQQLLTDGVQFAFDFDEGDVWHVALHVMDLNGSGFCRPLDTECVDTFDRADGTSLCLFVNNNNDVISYPDLIATEDSFIDWYFAITCKESQRPKKGEICFGATNVFQGDRRGLSQELDVWGLLEMMIDNRIKIA
jgi:hypothetical protein